MTLLADWSSYDQISERGRRPIILLLLRQTVKQKEPRRKEPRRAIPSSDMDVLNTTGIVRQGNDSVSDGSGAPEPV